MAVLGAPPAWAVALGSIHVKSNLTQRFKAKVPLSGLAPDQLSDVSVQVAPPAAFSKLGISREGILDNFKFHTLTGSDGKAYIEIRSSKRVETPVLSFLLQVNTPNGRLVRKYTVLLNPPSGEGATTSQQITAPVAVAGQSQATASNHSSHHPHTTASSQGSPHRRRYGPVHRHQTLWSIAKALRPDPNTITMDQMVMALYRTNPSAFDGGINHLRAGSMLRVPGKHFIQGIDPAQAHRETVAQISSYKALKAKQAAALNGELRLLSPGNNATQGTQGTPASGAAQTTNHKAAISVAQNTGTPAQGTNPNAGSQKVTTSAQKTQTTAATSKPSRASAASPAQTESLTSSVNTAPSKSASNQPQSQAGAVKGSQQSGQAGGSSASTSQAPKAVAQAGSASSQPQAQAGAVKSSQPSGQASSSSENASQAPKAVSQAGSASSQPQPQESADKGSQPSSQAGNSNANASQASSTTGVDSSAHVQKQVVGGKAAPAQPSKSPATQATHSKPKHMAHPAATKNKQVTHTATNAGLLGHTRPFLLGMALLLLLWLVFRSWSRRREGKAVDIGRLETVYPSAGPADPEPEDQTQVTAADPLNETESAVPADEEHSTSADGALADADFHISYGLYDDAIDILRGAIADSPTRRDLELKLLEAYYGAREVQAFITLAGKLHEDIDESGPEWRRIASMGAELAPNELLFGPSAEETEDKETRAEPVEEEPHELDLSAYQPESTGTASLDVDEQDTRQSIQETAEGLDFDLGADSETPSADQQIKTNEPPVGVADDETASDDALEDETQLDEAAEGDWRDAPLEFDLSDQEHQSADADINAVDETQPQTADQDMSTLDIEVDSPQGDHTESQVGNDEGESIPEFDIDAFLNERVKEASSEADDSGESAIVANDPAHEESDAVGREVSDIESLGTAGSNEDFDIDDLLGGNEEDDIGTRLDLARTYLDMGDPEMAKSLLDTVDKEGNEDQRKEAASLRDRID